MSVKVLNVEMALLCALVRRIYSLFKTLYFGFTSFQRKRIGLVRLVLGPWRHWLKITSVDPVDGAKDANTGSIFPPHRKCRSLFPPYIICKHRQVRGQFRTSLSLGYKRGRERDVWTIIAVFSTCLCTTVGQQWPD